jgi:IPT/TIG domain
MKHIPVLLFTALLAFGTLFGASCGSSYNSMASTAAGAPTISELSPNDTNAGGAAFVLTVNGSNFSASSVVYFSGTPETTTYVSASQVMGSIPAAAIANSGMMAVYVRTGTLNSATVNFPVN